MKPTTFIITSKWEAQSNDLILWRIFSKTWDKISGDTTKQLIQTKRGTANEIIEFANQLTK